MWSTTKDLNEFMYHKTIQQQLNYKKWNYLTFLENLRKLN